MVVNGPTTSTIRWSEVAARRLRAPQPASLQGDPARRAGAGFVADGRASSTTCSRPSSTAVTSTTPPAGCAARGVGFYTIGSAGHEANALRRQRAATHRPGPAALPLGRLLPGPGPPGPGPRRRARRAARPAGVERRADRRRPAQGVRPRRPVDHPADVDDRLAPAAGDGGGVRHRPGRLGSAAELRWPADAIAVTSFGDASLNHSTAQGALNAAAYTAHQGTGDAAAVRVRGQRLGDQRADAGRLGAGRRSRGGPGCATSRPTAATRSASTT